MTILWEINLILVGVIFAKRSATINAMLIIWYLPIMERLSIAWDVCTGLMEHELQ